MSTELGQRVSSLEADVRSIVDMLKGLSTKLDEKSKPQYALIVSIGLFGMAVLSAIGALAYWPIANNAVRIEHAIERLADRADKGDKELRDTMVTRAEYDRMLRLQDRITDRMLDRLDFIQGRRSPPER